jgi:[ribosomal protein S18]-alanine N-acetyltransferase
MNSTINTHIRWMIRRDMPLVLAIEEVCFSFPWDEEAFFRCLRNRNCIGMVAERDEQIVGYMVYELHRSLLRILNFAVHPQHHRSGIGTAMVAKLIGKLSSDRRTRIELEVGERNLSAQLFFRQMRFLAVGVLEGFYVETDDAAYRMQYCLETQEG